MNILVLMKEVPDMDKVKFDSERGVVDRSSAEAELNPFDLYALQTAVDLKNKYSVNITAISMGPPKTVKSLRDAFARGADNGILLTDRKFGGADTWATAFTLAAGIKHLKNYDLIICGEKSVDGDTAQVGAEVAEFLDIPHSYYVEQVNNIDKDSIEVQVENICGNKQVRKMSLPALISVSKNISHPELPTLKRKLESLSKEISSYGIDDLRQYISAEQAGIKGSPTKVSKIQVPKAESRNSIIYREELNDFMSVIKSELKEKNII